MQIQTKFLWLPKGAAIGDRIGGWRVCWVGGWDRCRVFFVVMVMRSASSSSRLSMRPRGSRSRKPLDVAITPPCLPDATIMKDIVPEKMSRFVRAFTYVVGTSERRSREPLRGLL
jgi:hypothetical protein